jgi:hypothetical protein
MNLIYYIGKWSNGANADRIRFVWGSAWVTNSNIITTCNDILTRGGSHGDIKVAGCAVPE